MAAATQVLNNRTYALATMTEIAAALDLRDATLYYYFPSKQALFYACHRRSLERVAGFLARAEDEGGTGAAKVECFLDHLIEESARDGPLLYYGDYFHLQTRQRRLIAAWADRLTVRLEAFFKQGIEDGSIVPCDTKLVVQLFLGMLIWLAKWVPSVDDLTVEGLLDAIKTFSLGGLTTRRNQAS